MTFELNGQEFIELNKLLKLTGVAESGGFANMVIIEEAVKVNGETEIRKRKKLHKGDVVEFNGERIDIVA
ncbi:MAG: RNA-binding protein [Marinilabiliales bacterium]|nr:MAG: RNA-binding protein [Marinilabiliales bacterium]